MHRTNCPLVLVERPLECASAFVDVAPQTTHKTHIVGSVDKDTDVQEVQYARLGEDQNSFDDHNWLWFDYLDLVATGVRHKIVERHVDRQSLLEPDQMIDEHVAVDRVGMIKVRLMPFV